MSAFRLTLASPERVQAHDAVESFVGGDASGRFGIMAGHVPMATVLSWGLARFRERGGEGWRYVALPGGTLHFADGHLRIACRSFVVGDALDAVRATLEQAFAWRAAQRADLRHNLDQLEQALMQRLWRDARG